MQATQPLVILGSARKNGDTRKLVDLVFGETKHTFIDLLDFQVAPYNYEEVYPEGDQFLEVAEEIFNHQAIVFATPVYWYSMSAQMKTVFDRLTDLLKSKEALRDRLRGKKVFVMAVSAGPAIPNGFELPFSETASYLHMEFGGSLFSPSWELHKTPGAKADFLQKVNQSVLV